MNNQHGKTLRSKVQKKEATTNVFTSTTSGFISQSDDIRPDSPKLRPGDKRKRFA
jgi:hypothetical protein